MIFNGFLSVVMASIFFSVAEAASTSKAKVQVLMLLSIVIILVNNYSSLRSYSGFLKWG